MAAFHAATPGVYWLPSPTDSTFSQAPHLTLVPPTPTTQATSSTITPTTFTFNLWSRIDTNIKRMRFDRSFAVPRDHWDWLTHEDSLKRSRTRVEVRRIMDRRRDEVALKKMDPRFKLQLDRRLTHDGLSAVLAKPTIWQPSYADSPDQSPWPPCSEFKHEGDERHTSQMDRFFPSPRLARNDTCNWQQGTLRLQTEMDETLPVPWQARYYSGTNHWRVFPWWNTINDPLESDPAANLRSVWHHVERVEKLLDETDDDY